MNANRLAAMLIVASPVFTALPAYAVNPASSTQPPKAVSPTAPAPAAGAVQAAHMPRYARPRLTAADRSADRWNQVSLGLAKQNINTGDKPLPMPNSGSPHS